MKRLGVDIGSLCLSAVLLEDGRIVARHSCSHEGRINALVQSLISRAPFSLWDSAGVTGSFAGAEATIDNTLATIEGAKRLVPRCNNLIAMGGQSFSLILLDSEGRYVEHVSNPPCASGTGSFLQQQAERLGLSIEDLARRAAAFTAEVPRIATRCAVFAKTDIVHAIQEGHSLEAICAGLCEGIARSMLDTILKGRKLSAPVGLVGGVALNRTITRTISRILGIPVEVPADCQYAGALGAALLGKSSSIDGWTRTRRAHGLREVRKPLPTELEDYPSLNSFEISTMNEVEIFSPRDRGKSDLGFFLGIDIGSTSTKAVLVTPDGRIGDGFYTRTSGNPVGAVQRLLRVIEGAQGVPRLLGAATTGSGRSIVRHVFQADSEVNEITAHAKAAVFLRPDVDTIIEIGGQDSKFTRIRDGDVYFSTMNYVCAAGTGSFIEEQAKRLGVSLSDFSDMAFAECAPFTSDRCTVYMERDLAALIGEGWARETLAAAVLHSVRDNYLSKVVGKSALGNSIVFQGATARIKALVAAFEQRLGKTLHVSPWCHLTGAVGAALLCREQGLASSHFLWETGQIVLESEECGLCANHCRVAVADRGGSRTGWGMKCGREYADRRPPLRGAPEERASAMEEHFRAAMVPLYEQPVGLSEAAQRRRAITIGVPRSLYNISYEPLWHSFLSRLGFSVVVSDQRRDALDVGAELVNSDFCAPIVLSHGYVRQLVDRGIDFIFLPAVENSVQGSVPIRSTFRRKDSDSAYCYYSQYLPSVVAKVTALDVGDRLISPLLPLREKTTEEVAGLLHEALAARFPDLSLDETVRAFKEANALFAEVRKQLAGAFQKAPSENDKLRILFLGRPYVALDKTLSLSLPQTFERLGAAVYWQEELDLEDFPLTYSSQFLERMHWHYGKLIVSATEFAARTDNLFPVFLTCFRCSPDSFLMSYVKDILAHFGKPFLFLQLDAHASDVGYLTRIEAAFHSFRNHREREKTTKEPRGLHPVVHARNDQLSEGDTVLIPAVDTLISRFWADVFARMGHPVVLLEAGATALNTGYRFSSGGECMPLVSIVGAAIEKMNGDSLDPSKTFFFMPTSPFSCNMPQFPVFSDMAFHAAGIKGLKIGQLNFMALGDTLPQTLSVKILETYIVACILYKLASRIRPYEKNRGDTDRAFHDAEERLRTAIRSGADLRASLTGCVDLFRAVPRDESAGRKPRVALLGDLYVKYNAVMNEGIQSLVEKLGGELIISSMTEYPAHLLDIGVRRYGEDPRSTRILRSMEQRYEKLAEDLIADQAEPDFAECVELMEKNGFSHYIAGETSINVGRALWYCAHRAVEAVLHVNPMFCCPGVVTASLYRKIQADFGIPIIDIFYDGAGSPNQVLIPHLHYLTAMDGRKRDMMASKDEANEKDNQVADYR
jgi:predicted CoA-substrate-specific enzyme activase